MTVWVKRMDVAGAQYVEVENVDLQQTVSKFKARWMTQAKLDLDPSLVTLRLVKCGERKPNGGYEAQAEVLDDPSLSLAAAGVADAAWLLAHLAGVGTPAAAPPARLLTVASRARGRQQLSEWHLSTQSDLDRHLAHGLLWQVDAGGKLIRSAVLLSELSADPAAQYYFQLTAEVGAVESATAAIANIAAGTERESTRGIAADALVQQTFGTVTPLLDGEPFEFSGDGEGALLEVDGLLGADDGAWVLLNSAKLTAGKGDVYEALASAAKLHDLLRTPSSNFPASLAAYASARVHAFLSASHFLPGVQELAVQRGITPVQCSGTHYHVPAHAASSLPNA